jgi:hypothetical protein
MLTSQQKIRYIKQLCETLDFIEKELTAPGEDFILP